MTDLTVEYQMIQRLNNELNNNLPKDYVTSLKELQLFCLLFRKISTIISLDPMLESELANYDSFYIKECKSSSEDVNIEVVLHTRSPAGNTYKTPIQLSKCYFSNRDTLLEGIIEKFKDSIQNLQDPDINNLKTLTKEDDYDFNKII